MRCFSRFLLVDRRSAVKRHGEEMPRHITMYARSGYQTSFQRGVTPPDLMGITILSAPQLDQGDFYFTFPKNGVQTAVGTVTKRFDVWQWIGEPRPATDPRYKVVVFQSKGMNDWRCNAGACAAPGIVDRLDGSGGAARGCLRPSARLPRSSA